MLADARTHATLPAEDLERARRFYDEKLGLTPAEVAPGGLFYETTAGTRFLVFPTGGRPSGAHTQMGFRVQDIEAEVAALSDRGVEFEHYEGLTDDEGIATRGDIRSAWFKDSEGNLLGVVQLP